MTDDEKFLIWCELQAAPGRHNRFTAADHQRLLRLAGEKVDYTEGGILEQAYVERLAESARAKMTPPAPRRVRMIQRLVVSEHYDRDGQYVYGEIYEVGTEGVVGIRYDLGMRTYQVFKGKSPEDSWLYAEFPADSVHGVYYKDPCPAFTTNLDAALTLVPEHVVSPVAETLPDKVEPREGVRTYIANKNIGSYPKGYILDFKTRWSEGWEPLTGESWRRIRDELGFERQPFPGQEA